MAASQIMMKTQQYIQKYKYAILVLMIGILLMCLPSISLPEQQKESDTIQIKESDETRLASILSKIQGAGRVDVLLTVEKGQETVFQTDSDRSTDVDHSDSQDKTVIIVDHERNEAALIKQIISPSYMGAVVVCDGADDPAVRLSIVDAVSKVTGLGTNKISVLKMK